MYSVSYQATVPVTFGSSFTTFKALSSEQLPANHVKLVSQLEVAAVFLVGDSPEWAEFEFREVYFRLEAQLCRAAINGAPHRAQGPESPRCGSGST